LYTSQYALKSKNVCLVFTIEIYQDIIWSCLYFVLVIQILNTTVIYFYVLLSSLALDMFHVTRQAHENALDLF